MKFEKVLQDLKEGRRIRRTYIPWTNLYGFIQLKKDTEKIASDNAYDDFYKVSGEDICADDWEVVKGKRIVKHFW